MSLQGRRQEIYDSVKDSLSSDVHEGRCDEYREKLPAEHTLFEAFDEFLGRELSFFKILFHKLLIILGNHLSQFFELFLRFFFHVRRDFLFLKFPAFILFKNIGLPGDQIDHSLEILFLSDGELDRNRLAAEKLMNRFHGPGVIGILPIQLIDDDYRRKFGILEHLPYFLCSYFNTCHSTYEKQARIHGSQTCPCIPEEIRVAGAIHKVNLAAIPF